MCRLLRARFNFNSRSPSGSKLALCPAVALRSLPNFCPLATYQGVRPNPLGLFVLDVPTYQGLKSCLFLGNKSLVARVNRSWMNIYRTATRPRQLHRSIRSTVYPDMNTRFFRGAKWNMVDGWFEKWRASPLYFSPPLRARTPCVHTQRATLALVPPHDERIHIHGVISGPWNMLLVNVSAALSSHRWSSRYPSYYYKLYSSISFHIAKWSRKLGKTRSRTDFCYSSENRWIELSS